MEFLHEHFANGMNFMIVTNKKIRLCAYVVSFMLIFS